MKMERINYCNSTLLLLEIKARTCLVTTSTTTTTEDDGNDDDDDEIADFALLRCCLLWDLLINLHQYDMSFFPGEDEKKKDIELRRAPREQNGLRPRRMRVVCCLIAPETHGASGIYRNAIPSGLVPAISLGASGRDRDWLRQRWRDERFLDRFATCSTISHGFSGAIGACDWLLEHDGLHLYPAEWECSGQD